MSISVSKTHLSYKDNGQTKELEGFLMLPENLSSQSMGIFTHGYTSHKISILSWCTRLAESGMATMVFDLPGHYLGTFNDISSFELFKTVAPELFVSAHQKLTQAIKEKDPGQQLENWSLALGGHSLGALVSLLASTKEELNQQHRQILLAVGFGLPPAGTTHVFESPFYKATLEVRRQFVSPALSPEVILPWIKEQKEKLTLTDKTVYLLTGQDDVVVGPEGSEQLLQKLEEQGNIVTLEKPLKLAHHMPETAAPHIRKIFRDLDLIQ